jgi:hypothetical protein
MMPDKIYWTILPQHLAETQNIEGYSGGGKTGWFATNLHAAEQ